MKEPNRFYPPEIVKEAASLPRKKPAQPRERLGLFPCLCCGCRTLPVSKEDAVAYICPVCMWENDVFTASDDEPSDENHGLTLVRGRANYRLLGVCDPRLAPYARKPRPEELL